MTPREFAVEVVRKLRDADYQAFWAGGCVRDLLLGRAPNDYDVATDARPEQVRRVFRRTIRVGEAFGVVRVLEEGRVAAPLGIEVATFRSDGDYSDGRHPDRVTFSSAREDALRRDFTINGMFFDPIAEQVIDYVGGRADLEAGILRAIGDPAERFREDKLRLLRAVRFATRFQLRLDPATADAVKAMADQIMVVSAERIAEELRKLLTDPRRADGVHLLAEVRLVGPILPELRESLTAGGDWPHLLRVVERLPADAGFPLALAALLHRIGRERAAEACLRLKLSNAERERVEWLVENHRALIDAESQRPSRLYPVLVQPGIADLLALHRADAEAEGQGTGHVEHCERLLRDVPREMLNPPPLLTGDDLKAHGLNPGPAFKRLLDAVRTAQLDGEVKTKEESLALVDRHIKKNEAPPG
jgi:poly(A) polymerase